MQKSLWNGIIKAARVLRLMKENDLDCLRELSAGIWTLALLPEQAQMEMKNMLLETRRQSLLESGKKNLSTRLFYGIHKRSSLRYKTGKLMS